MNPEKLILTNGNTADNQAYTGDEATLSYNTETHRLRVHDGATVGGFGLLLQSGDTMTGPLSFSGQSHAGLRLNNVSTFFRNQINPRLPGMIIWNINTNRIEYVNQSLQWVALTGGPALTPQAPLPPVSPKPAPVKQGLFRRVSKLFHRK